MDAENIRARIDLLIRFLNHAIFKPTVNISDKQLTGYRISEGVKANVTHYLGSLKMRMSASAMLSSVKPVRIGPDYAKRIAVIRFLITELRSASALIENKTLVDFIRFQ